jgi:hypothetical protein
LFYGAVLDGDVAIKRLLSSLVMRDCYFAGIIADAETLHPHKHRVPWRNVTLICVYAELTALMRRFFALRNRSFFTHDLARKQVPTFRDHAPRIGNPLKTRWIGASGRVIVGGLSGIVPQL